MAGHVALVGAHHLRHLHELGVERADAGQRAEVDDEEHGDRHQRDLGLDADAEPQDEQRRQRQLGRAVAADHERVEDGGDDRQAAQREGQSGGGDGADEEAGNRLEQRVGGMAQYLAARARRSQPRGDAPAAIRSSRCRDARLSPARSRTGRRGRAAWSPRARSDRLDARLGAPVRAR